MTREEMVGEGLVTIKDAQAFLAVSRQTVWRMMGAGEIPYVRIGSARRIPKRALVHLAAGKLIRRDK